MSVALRDFSPKDYPVRLPGHGLVSEGIPAFLKLGCAEDECPNRMGEFEESDRASGQFAGGHGRCQCGAVSEHLPSQGARRRWHKDHKREAAS
jgi:hypothetical protein